MTTRKFRWIIFLLTASLVALIGVQLFWINHAIRLSERQFNVNVKEALKNATSQVEKEATCFETFSRINIKPHEGLYMIRQKWEGDEHFLQPVFSSNHVVRNMDTIPLNFYFATRTDTLYSFNSLKFGNPASAEMVIRFRYELADSLQGQEEELSDSGKIERLTASAFKMKNKKDHPLGDQIDAAGLDSILRDCLHQQGVDIGFEYAVISSGDSSIIFSNTKETSRLVKSDLGGTLFQNSYFTDPFRLLLYFPDRRSLIPAALRVVLLSSALVIVILLTTFYFGMRMVWRQKKLSELKTDFINNMTHEFKTPVSVISLALETVNTSRILSDKPKLEKILEILKTESQRLEMQVERILQFSSFERNEMKMDFRETDVHQLIRNAVRNFSLQIEDKQAEVLLNLNASQPVINADEMHFTNLLSNLIDNALKYRNGSLPLIKVETESEKENVLISVEDNGIGMEKDTLTKIFDKFYRVPTGDVHNIKGFGIGLSYVKSVVEAHQGSIAVDSVPGYGSRFTIRVPRSNMIQPQYV